MRVLASSALLALALAACGGGEEAQVYEVTLNVAYSEELRVPGFGYVLHEFRLDYQLAAAAPPGELVEPEADGTASWTVRCYEDQFAADQQPFAEFSGTHPAIFEWDRDDLRRAGQLESGVDWTEGPAVLIAEEEGVVHVAHRLPAAIAADRPIGCDAEDQYTAIALSLGGAAMTAPGRVVSDAGELTRAEALNDTTGPVRYLLDEAGSGWLVYEVAAADLTATLTPFAYAFDPGPEPEGGAAITIQGTVRAAPGE